MDKRMMYFFIGLLCIANVFLGWLFYNSSKQKQAYIQIEKVYDGFNGKLAVEKELKGVENKQQNILDTLKLEITDLETKSNRISGVNKDLLYLLEVKKGDYARLVEEFSNYNTQESQKRVQGLLKQINQYVKDYGEKNGYDFIFGAAGNGSLMYAKEEKDLTQEIIKYINTRYDGE